MLINILAFEDSSTKLVSFEKLLSLRLEHELNHKLKIVQRTDDSMLESDLIGFTFHLIIVDDDLGNGAWGNEVIEKIFEVINTTPDIKNIPIVYYSAGTAVQDLEGKIKKIAGNIPCLTFESLTDSVFEIINKKYKGS